jgi:hypothetical protein
MSIQQTSAIEELEALRSRACENVVALTKCIKAIKADNIKKLDIPLAYIMQHYDEATYLFTNRYHRILNK